MDTKSRAEKIFLMRSMFVDNRIGQDIIVSKIKAIIDEVAREAVESYTRLPVSTRDFDRGYAAAREQAAGIAIQEVSDKQSGSLWSRACRRIAERIRAMRPAASPGGK